jgi:urease alpha subunit
MPFEIDRSLYACMYGPAVGDRLRLGDTNLLVEVERDDTAYGDETVWGFGKTNRSTRTCSPGEAEHDQAQPTQAAGSTGHG